MHAARHGRGCVDAEGEEAGVRIGELAVVENELVERAGAHVAEQALEDPTAPER